MAGRRASTSGVTESLPLKERNGASARPPETASPIEDNTVSPFADPSEEPDSPFADPPPAQRPRRGHIRQQTDLNIISPFADPPDVDSAVAAPTASPTKETLRSPVSADRERSVERPGRSKEQPDKTKRRRKYIYVGVVALILVVVAAIIAGVVVGKKKSASSGEAGTLENSAGVVQFTNTKDPSTYIKDPRLSNSFYGITYTPLGVEPPACGGVQANVTEDIILLSQLTTRIRLFAENCNQSSMVLEAIKQTKVDLQVYLAVNLTLNTTSYYEQATGIQESILIYGVENVAGIVVGNQFIASYLAAHNDSDPNSSWGANAAIYVSSMMQEMRASLAELNLSKAVPVGTADGGNMFTPILLEEVDFAMATVEPYRSNIQIGSAAAYTDRFFREFALSTAQATSNSPPMYIGETGWPSGFTGWQNNTTGNSYPGANIVNFQTYLNTFVCPANHNGTGYFFYEYFDEPWRQQSFGGVEGTWGIFTSDKQLKNVTIPSCTHS